MQQHVAVPLPPTVLQNLAGKYETKTKILLRMDLKRGLLSYLLIFGLNIR